MKPPHAALHVCTACLMVVSAVAIATDKRVSPAIEAIVALAESSAQQRFTVVADQTGASGVARQLVSFSCDGLKQYALLLHPPGEAPAGGWPLLIFNHGYHPNPSEYGLRGTSGQRRRPGDYYRGIPQVYAERGFVVVAPDFRGHAESDGSEFTQRTLAKHWYVRDAIQATLVARALPFVDPQQTFMAGHSMGAYITLRAALALGDRLQRISLWSPSGDDLVTQLYNIDMVSQEQDLGVEVASSLLDKLHDELTQLELHFDDLRTLAHLEELQSPVQIQHGRGDTTTPLRNSYAIASRLRLAGLSYRVFIYDANDHLFTKIDLKTAVERDLEWFQTP